MEAFPPGQSHGHLEIQIPAIHIEIINKCNSSKCSDFGKTYLVKITASHMCSWCAFMAPSINMGYRRKYQ